MACKAQTSFLNLFEVLKSQRRKFGAYMCFSPQWRMSVVAHVRGRWCAPSPCPHLRGRCLSRLSPPYHQTTRHQDQDLMGTTHTHTPLPTHIHHHSVSLSIPSCQNRIKTAFAAHTSISHVGKNILLGLLIINGIKILHFTSRPVLESVQIHWFFFWTNMHSHSFMLNDSVLHQKRSIPQYKWISDKITR